MAESTRNNKSNNSIKQDRKTNLKKLGKQFLDFLVVSFNGMAFGLFATLIIGVIIQQIGLLIGEIPGASTLSEYIIQLATILKSFMGVGIGIGIAYMLKLEGLKLVAGALAGGIGTLFRYGTGNPLNDPMVAYFCVIGVYLVFKYLLKKKTPIDIILVPLIGGIIGFIIAFLLGAPVKSFMDMLGAFIQTATDYQPFLMGIIIAVLMGMFLTMPISSAAIAISISLGSIAGGAAVVGCSVQMLGFAVMSRKDNNIGTVISVGIGTSMLQFKNILRKPIIWLPTIIVSAILGPLATLVFKTQTNPIGSGMGTSGLVGQIATFDAMGYTSSAFLSIGILQIALPIILVWILDVLFRKKGLIQPGDLKI